MKGGPVGDRDLPDDGEAGEGDASMKGGPVGDRDRRFNPGTGRVCGPQ